MNEKETLIRFLDSVGDWVDSGILRENKLHYEGRDYLLGYRADRNARDLVSKENALKDDFVQEGEYKDIRFMIAGRMRRGDKCQKIRQYRLRILNGEKPQEKEDRRHEPRRNSEFDDLNRQLKELRAKIRPSWDNYATIDEISRAIKAKYPETKKPVLEKYKDKF